MMNALKSPAPRAGYHNLRDRETRVDSAVEEGHSPTSCSHNSDKPWSDDSESGVMHLRNNRRERMRTAMISCRSLVDTVLLLVILWLVVDRRWSVAQRFEYAGDLSGFAPRFSQRITTFESDPEFVPQNVSEIFTEEVKEKWLSIVPTGLGYVRINDTGKYDNLPTQLNEYPDHTFTTSMTHQLHCLHAIFQIVAAYASGQTEKLPPEGPWHVSHCFDYLRQSIMCCGDVALEGQQTTFPEGFTGSDGWDAKHVCKDYNQIMSYLEKNRADDEVWI